MNKMFNQKNLLSLGIGLGVAYYFLVMKPKAEAQKKREELREAMEGEIFENPYIPMPEYIEQEGTNIGLPEDFDPTDIGIIVN